MNKFQSPETNAAVMPLPSGPEHDDIYTAIEDGRAVSVSPSRSHTPSPLDRGARRPSDSRTWSPSPGRNKSRSPEPSSKGIVHSRQSIYSEHVNADELAAHRRPSSRGSVYSRQSIYSKDRGADELAARRRPSSLRSRRSDSTVHLDRENPGDYVIRHHRDSLVIRLRDHKPGKFQSALAGVKKKISRARLGSRHNSSKDADKEAQRQEEPSAESGDNKRFRISFAEVQRMRIRKLQCQLVRHVVKMRVSGHESPGWEKTLETYIKALQDHDYMEHRSKSARDPFLATGEYAIDNYVLNCNIDSILANDKNMRNGPSIQPWEPHPTDDPLHDFDPICGTRRGNIAQTWYHGFKSRVLLAALGGAFLIGPMWLMVLQDGKFTGLGTTTGFVTVFGITMAYFLEEGKDVLASTAAYAAVLVVFVGTSTSS